VPGSRSRWPRWNLNGAQDNGANILHGILYDDKRAGGGCKAGENKLYLLLSGGKCNDREATGCVSKVAGSANADERES
jgi:hypothetical protein